MPSSLKKRVHSRQEKTGESYQTALENVRKDAPQLPAKRASEARNIAYVVWNGGRYMSNRYTDVVVAPTHIPTADVIRCVEVPQWSEVQSAFQAEKRREDRSNPLHHMQMGSDHYLLTPTVTGLADNFRPVGDHFTTHLWRFVRPGHFLCEDEHGPWTARPWTQFERSDEWWEEYGRDNPHFLRAKWSQYGYYEPLWEATSPVLLHWLIEAWKVDKLEPWDAWCLERVLERAWKQ